MKILVSDSSILIEFSKRKLLDRMFALGFQFAVPDLLFREELIDSGVLREQRLAVADLIQTDEIAVMNSVRGWRSAKLLVSA